MESPFSSSSPLSNGTVGSFRPPRPKVTAASFLALLPALAAGVIVGVIYHFIARFLDLLIIFPLAAGGITGVVLAGLVEKNKVRSKFAVALVGLVAGLLCFGAREFSDSLYDREMEIPAFAMEKAGNDAKLAAKWENQLRSDYPPLKYFPLYLQDAAERGISITSTHSSSSSNKPVTGLGFWAIFLADAAMIICTATAVGVAQAKKLYCEPCDGWYGPDLTVTRLHPNQSDEAVKLVQSGDYTGLGNLRGEGAGEQMHCDVMLTKCNGCGVGHLKIVSTQGKKVKTIWEGDPSPKEISTLEEVRAQWLK